MKSIVLDGPAWRTGNNDDGRRLDDNRRRYVSMIYWFMFKRYRDFKLNGLGLDIDRREA